MVHMKSKVSPGLLLASPHLLDPNFYQTVVLMFEHQDDGALGIVINRQLEIRLQEVLADLEIEPRAPLDQLVQFGGPVSNEIGWVVHSSDYEEPTTRQVADGVSISTSREVLKAVGEGTGPRHHMLCLGYAGWGPKQLEYEIEQGAWLSAPLDPAILFDVPLTERWQRGYDSLGINPRQFAPTVGNA